MPDATMNNTMSKPPHQMGISLVEVLIYLVLSLFLLAGTVTIFVSNKHAFRAQEAAIFMQENARFSMDFLGRSIRMADNWGGVEYDRIDTDGSLAITGIGGCNQTWLTNLNLGIQGFDGDTNIGSVSGFPNNCIDNADYLAETDILVLRYADSEQADNGDVYLRSAVSRGGTLGLAPSSGDLPTFGITEEFGTLNNPYRVEVWFVRPCSNRAGGTDAVLCDDADDGGSPIPTLTVLTLSGNTLSQQPMLEGIEQLQLEYGRDTDDDGDVDRYDTADTMNALATPTERETAWREVLSVRVALIARSGQYDVGTTDNRFLYLAGDTGAQSAGVQPAGEAQKYQRKAYQQTLQIRNRVRS